MAGDLLRQGYRHLQDEHWLKLLEHPPAQWKRILGLDDDPVPQGLVDTIADMPLDNVRKAFDHLPRYQTANWKVRVANARNFISLAVNDLWGICIRKLNLSLPLLIMDEAHHLKNAETRLASLFQCKEAVEDADEMTSGPLAGAFERMLFLTATPFQLGHYELCSVLGRFQGISWRKESAPIKADGSPQTDADFATALKDLRETLNAAQEAAVRLDVYWGQLRPNHMVVDGSAVADPEEWWRRIEAGGKVPAIVTQVMDRYRQAQARMREAEGLLRMFLVRHTRPRFLPLGVTDKTLIRRRLNFTGKSILEDCEGDHSSGLPIHEPSLLPFLLAARAAVLMPRSRPVFAEGLASSYSAFLHTRRQRAAAKEPIVDADDDMLVNGDTAPGAFAEWYLERLEAAIPREGEGAIAAHPKVAATVRRVVDLWKTGEKVLVFCHYLATGRELRLRISEAIDREIKILAAAKLRCPEAEVDGRLEQIGERFDREGPLRRTCAGLVKDLVTRHGSQLALLLPDIQIIVRRYLRTPAFLARFFPLSEERMTEDSVVSAFQRADSSGLTLAGILIHFVEFLADRCSPDERKEYLDALGIIQTGGHSVIDRESAFGSEDTNEEERRLILPNVKLANGKTPKDTRSNLMLTFNTPFYPEVLVASMIMAEGVDLHLNCRHVIHHDLCWNPSTLEQRTGRVDRIGAKVERCRQPIRVYLPYVAETQDQKMYQVVMDRERWFSVLMGEDYRIDTLTIEKLSERVPFPETAARELLFRLNV